MDDAHPETEQARTPRTRPVPPLDPPDPDEPTPGRVFTVLAVVLAGVAVFYQPLIMAALAVVLAMIARRRGDPDYGVALVIAAISLVIGLLLQAVLR